MQLAYQYGNTNDFYVVDQRDDAAGPNGHPPDREISLFNLNLAYGLSNRVNLDLTVPFSDDRGGSYQGTPASNQYYGYHITGLGDMSLQAEFWLSDPTKPSGVSGSVGLGVLAPTGSDSVTGTFADGSVRPITETLQPGSGGWSLLFRAQGTAELGGPFWAYGSGIYGMSLNTRTDVIEGGTYRAVPDSYSARLGAAYLLPVLQGLVLSLGGRINGITVRDLIGGGDLYWRRPGYEVFFEPGLTWTSGPNMASVSVPLRAYQRKLDSLYDVSRNIRIGADFFPYLILASYARRF